MARVASTNPRMLLQVPANQEDELRMAFVSGLDASSLRARLAVMPAYVVLQYVPQLLGRSNSLDKAASCICSDGSAASQHAGYGRALRSIQVALWDDDTAVSSETLAAAVVLQMHENFIGHNSEGWVHAKGVATLLRLRGSSRIKTDMDRAILQSEVGTIFVDSLYKREACFLSQPDWAEVLQATNLDQSIDAPGMSALVVVMLQFPALLNKYEVLFRRDGSLDDKTEAGIIPLVSELIAFRNRILACSFTDDAEHRTSREYSNMLPINRVLQPLVHHLASAIASFLLAEVIDHISISPTPLSSGKRTVEAPGVTKSDAEGQCFASAIMAAYLLDQYNRPPRREITNMLSIVGRVWNVAKDIHLTYCDTFSPLVAVLDNVWTAQALEKLPLHTCYG